MVRPEQIALVHDSNARHGVAAVVQSVEFEGGNIVLDKTAYRLDGADELWRQLAAIKNSQ